MRRKVLLVVLTAFLAAAFLVPVDTVCSLPPVCLTRILTGFDCPGCGMTRALVSLAHGDLAGALAFHPLVPVVAALLVGLFAALTLEAAFGRSLRVEGRQLNRVALFLLALFLLTWVIRTCLTLAAGGRPWERSVLAGVW